VSLLSESVYRNAGNREAVGFVPATANRILDVGCGAGDNARMLAASGREVVGVTLSREEARLASPHCTRVIVADIETERLPLEKDYFDVLLLSHVLEHLRDPAGALNNLLPFLKPGGAAVIAVPNMAHWRERWRFVKGDWSREETGPMDRTHLNFWSFHTATDVLERTPLQASVKAPGDLAIPLWPLRRALPRLSSYFDRAVGKHIPNFAATQVLLIATRPA
jgi:SAM-dependent methyltransferase